MRGFVNHCRPFRHDRVRLRLAITFYWLRALLNPLVTTVQKRLLLTLLLLHLLLQITTFSVQIAITGLSLMLLRRLHF